MMERASTASASERRRSSEVLVGPEVALTDDEIDNLIFLPGFSTAATISDISGRGVGMDVCAPLGSGDGRTHLDRLEPGARLHLHAEPATDAGGARWDGGQDKRPDAHRPARRRSGNAAAQYRGHLSSGQPKLRSCPARRLRADRRCRRGFGVRTEKRHPGAIGALLVESEGGSRAILLVDEIQGQRQVVIKSIEANYRAVYGIAAATVMGDGNVALILDVDAIVSVTRETARTDSSRSILQVF